MDKYGVENGLIRGAGRTWLLNEVWECNSDHCRVAGRAKGNAREGRDAVIQGPEEEKR